MKDNNDNPYAPPKSLREVQAIDNSEGVYRYGDKVIFVPVGQDLPHRCVKCNQRANPPLLQQKFYHNRISPTIILLIGTILLGMLGYIDYVLLLIVIVVIFASITQKKSKVRFGFCPKHQKRRLYLQIFWASLFILSMILIVYFNLNHFAPVYLFMAFNLIPISLIGFYFNKPRIRCQKIDNDGTYLTGFGKEFLQSFNQSFN